jgi:hypothetical protein
MEEEDIPGNLVLVDFENALEFYSFGSVFQK